MSKITIFGLAGTGTSTVGKLLSEKLSYKYLSTGDIFFRKKAQELGITLAELHERAKNDPATDRECDEAVRKFGQENDNFVVESRLAWFFIPDSFKIKLTCDFDIRTKRLAERDKLSFEDAKTHILEREKIDAERYRKFYGISDLGPDEKFDIIVDSTNTPAAKIVEMILSKI